jgi:hypothetical protein
VIVGGDEQGAGCGWTTVIDESKQLIGWDSSIPGWKNIGEGNEECKEEGEGEEGEGLEEFPPLATLAKQSSEFHHGEE